MTRPGILVCIVGAAACWGCRAKPATPLIQGRWMPAPSTHVQVQVERLGEVPNSGVQLPVVSPDGNWIAYLQLRGDEPVDLEALFTGEGLDAMSLYVQRVQRDAQPLLVCPSGAAWPAWSADGKWLVFVAYNEAGRCDLGIYDVHAGSTRRISAGLERVVMPALSPSGRQVAVVAWSEGSPTSRPGASSEQAPDPRSAGGEDTRSGASARLHVLTLATGRLQACPDDEAAVRQLWPQWTADDRIVYVLGREGRAWLVEWAPGEFPPSRLREIHVSGSTIGTFQAFAGLGRPLSPDDRRLAYYDTAGDCIVLVDIADRSGLRDPPRGPGVAERIELPAKTRAGCWLDPRRFVAASDEEMVLIVDAASPARLMRGPWLPRGAAGESNELILCAPGSHQWAFALVRMKVLLAR